MNNSSQVTVQGLVIAADWKQNGSVCKVDIAGYDEQKYRIADDQTGAKLLSLTQKRVIATGIVRMENNRMTLYVHHFRIDTSDPVQSPHLKII